ncbi:hypothetical protein M8494_31930 [Serratia ureilytica]
MRAQAAPTSPAALRQGTGDFRLISGYHKVRRAMPSRDTTKVLIDIQPQVLDAPPLLVASEE